MDNYELELKYAIIAAVNNYGEETYDEGIKLEFHDLPNNEKNTLVRLCWETDGRTTDAITSDKNDDVLCAIIGLLNCKYGSQERLANNLIKHMQGFYTKSIQELINIECGDR